MNIFKYLKKAFRLGSLDKKIISLVNDDLTINFDDYCSLNKYQKCDLSDADVAVVKTGKHVCSCKKA